MEPEHCRVPLLVGDSLWRQSSKESREEGGGETDLARYITSHGNRADWIRDPQELIKKTTLTIVAKSFRMLVRPSIPYKG